MEIILKDKFESRDLDVTGKVYSFLNPASLSSIWNSSKNEINYYIDGGLLVLFLNTLLRSEIKRVSFDYTSVAHNVFSKLERDKKKIFIFGATEEEIKKFISKLKSKYPEIIISGYSNGYLPRSNWNDLIFDIIQKKIDFTLVGLGSGLQEDFLQNLKESGYLGVGFSCGGFIRQEANSGLKEYYPKSINAMKLRSLYRMYKEPHTISRYLMKYPLNLFRLTFLILSKNIKFIIR